MDPKIPNTPTKVFHAYSNFNVLSDVTIPQKENRNKPMHTTRDISITENPRLQLVVMFAIVLHKNNI